MWSVIIVLVLFLISALVCQCVVMSTDSQLVSVDFEIFGNVQGVCFRMYTEDHGKKVGVVGWVMNTREGSVKGQVQGPADRVEEMKRWLRTTGSPSSRIDRAEFSNQRNISALEMRGFSTRYH